MIERWISSKATSWSPELLSFKHSGVHAIPSRRPGGCSWLVLGCLHSQRHGARQGVEEEPWLLSVVGESGGWPCGVLGCVRGAFWLLEQRVKKTLKKNGT